MSFTFSRAALLAVMLMAATGAAYGDDLEDFNTAVEGAASHNRAADGYLRTGNVDLASLEIDRLRERWAALTQQFGSKRPDAFKDVTLYTTTLLKVSTGLIGADMMMKSGRLEAARKSLDGMRSDLYALRKSAGVVVLADCIRDSNAMAAAVLVYDDRVLDWNKPETGNGLASATTNYLKTLDRCDAIAAPGVRSSPDFRRLIDGAHSGLAFIPKAIAARDGEMVRRVMGELRALDNLLSFRFG